MTPKPGDIVAVGMGNPLLRNSQTLDPTNLLLPTLLPISRAETCCYACLDWLRVRAVNAGRNIQRSSDDGSMPEAFNHWLTEITRVLAETRAFPPNCNRAGDCFETTIQVD